MPKHARNNMPAKTGQRGPRLGRAGAAPQRPRRQRSSFAKFLDLAAARRRPPGGAPAAAPRVRPACASRPLAAGRTIRNVRGVLRRFSYTLLLAQKFELNRSHYTT